MRRRDLIKGIAGSLTARPLATWAQPSADMPVVTLINARKAGTATVLAAEFHKGLGQAGLTEGKDVVVEYHWLIRCPLLTLSGSRASKIAVMHNNCHST